MGKCLIAGQVAAAVPLPEVGEIAGEAAAPVPLPEVHELAGQAASEKHRSAPAFEPSRSLIKHLELHLEMV